MINPLLLQSNKDIPFTSAKCTIHNPKIAEIALIGEEDFHMGSRFLNFNKNDFDFKDNSDLIDKSDFEILIGIMNSKEYYKFTLKALQVLTLLFPSYIITIEEKRIKLQSIEDETKIRIIDEKSYDEFREIIKQIFVLESKEDGGSYNPANDMARKIAEKLKKGREKAAKSKGEDMKDKSLYGRIISILAVGLGKDKNILFEYTVYQLLDEYKRFQLKTSYDMNFKMRLAGATDLDEPEDWLDNLLL